MCCLNIIIRLDNRFIFCVNSLFLLSFSFTGFYRQIKFKDIRGSKKIYWSLKKIKRAFFLLSKDKVYKDIEAEILPKIKDILRTKPSLRFA